MSSLEWIKKIIIIVIGSIVAAYGITLALYAGFGGATLAVLWQGKIVRMILDIVMVIIGVLLGGKFGICTIVTIIISGPVIQFTASKTKKVFNI